MSTNFDSFDESAHGAFVESPLGARNLLDIRLNIAFWVAAQSYFVDQTDDQVYDTDLALYISRKETAATEGIDLFIYGPFTEERFVLPPNRGFPGVIPVVNLTSITSDTVFNTVSNFLGGLLPTKWAISHVLGDPSLEAEDSLLAWFLTIGARPYTPERGIGSYNWIGRLAAGII